MEGLSYASCERAPGTTLLFERTEVKKNERPTNQTTEYRMDHITTRTSLFALNYLENDRFIYHIQIYDRHCSSSKTKRFVIKKCLGKKLIY